MKPHINGFAVYRFGDIEPSGLAHELSDARAMLRRGNVEGEVRDAQGKVVYEHRPKVPLVERIANATERVDQATAAKALAELELTRATRSLERLQAVKASRVAAKCKVTQVPAKDGE